MNFRSKMLLIGAIAFLIGSLAVCFGAPSPTPNDFSKVDYSKIPKSDIIKTIQSRDAIHLQLQQKFNDQQVHIVTQDKVLIQTAAALSDATTQLGIAQKKIQTQTDQLNAANDKVYAQSKALWWYRLHWWGAWIMLGLGILACGVFAFLKLTGRLAVLGTAIATKIP